MKRKIILSSILIVTIITLSLILNFIPKKQILDFSTKQATSNMISMMLEQDDGTYQESIDTSWPQKGYVFNATKSKCEQGSKLTWNDETGQVQVISNKSDKCYLYFDKATLAKVCEKKTINCLVQNADLEPTIYHHNGTIKSGETVIDANDDSYRYAGASYSVALPYTNQFKRIYADNVREEGTDNIIRYFCGDSEGIIGGYCSSSLRYYILANNTDIQYDSYDDAFSQAIKEGYIAEIVKNYVCLDEKETGECAADDLYRIIGLFKNENEKSKDYGKYELKLIKSNPYEGEDAETGSYDTLSGKGYYWSGSSTNKKNTWKDSTLNTEVLNKSYVNSLPEYVQEKITWHNYITGGNYYGSISSKYVYEAYQNEIITPIVDNFTTEEDKTSDARIALMYVSDYGYAAYQEAWATQTLNLYYISSVKNNNWLYISDDESSEWLITRLAGSSGYVFYVLGGYGSIKYNSYGYQEIYAVRPVFYLNNETVLKSGNGAKATPFRIE